MIGTLLKGSSVMFIDGSGCVVVDTEARSIEEFRNYMVPMKFQGWMDQVPTNLEDLARQIMREARR